MPTLKKTIKSKCERVVIKLAKLKLECFKLGLYATSRELDKAEKTIVLDMQNQHWSELVYNQNKEKI